MLNVSLSGVDASEGKSEKFSDLPSLFFEMSHSGENSLTSINSNVYSPMLPKGARVMADSAAMTL